MKPYLLVLSIAGLLAAVFNILDMPKHIFIVLVINTTISLLAVAIKAKLKKESSNM